jgi:endonuclease/exonuclease/phosphatase family metal-dependent hydrolase
LVHKLALFSLFLVTSVSVGCVQAADTLIRPERLTSCEGLQTPPTVRVATYNIKAGLESSLEEIGDVLEEMDADVIALQEVDRNAERTGNVDQARALAERLGMDSTYAATKKRGQGDFGIAILSRLPFASVERIELPGAFSFEPRVSLAADVCLGDAPLRVFATHSDTNPMASGAQQKRLAEIATPYVGAGVIVTGDFNATEADPGLQALQNAPLDDLGGAFGDAPTYEDRRIDFILADEPLAAAAESVEVVDTDASDHRPMVTQLRLDIDDEAEAN